ncbi:hypothetical protein DB30_03000 [Enhygromyxa salina]|uniref:phospholipase D n=1 Tax=Enhygromyxa salina TaxID=215803 RepID=A0A0C2D801_9BACT|nr:phosphatidylserine/phosphatidylglycerophosphate/cardiolipin synthase family protein [Enhygromyxa salina]KIG17725.1 hypothetical protein DB30_03000 [Enhygromyxa salina]
METFKHFTKIVDVSKPLPPSWIRVSATWPEQHEESGAGLLSAGPLGRLRDTLVREIEGAQETVLIASFLFSDEALCTALLAASKRGVRVYMLTASEARLQSRDDEAFSKQMVQEHKQLLNRLAGKVSLRSAGLFHAKFLVVDHQSNARGWLSTANLNPALLDARELGIQLDQTTAEVVAAWFCRAFWCHAEHELTSEKSRLSRVGKAPKVPDLPHSERVRVTTPGHTSIAERLLAWIRGSKRSITLASYGIELDHAVTQALIERARAGVEVKVLTRPRPAVLDAALALRQAGALVYAHDKLHAKAIVCDHGAMIMTANIAKEGLDDGFELGVELVAPQREALTERLAQWTGEFPWRFESQAQRSECIGEICLATMGLRDGKRQVVEERTVRLPDVTANDALDLDATPPPKFTPSTEPDELPARFRYEWRVLAPRLPNKAKKLEHSPTGAGTPKRKSPVAAAHDPQAYELRGQRFVVIEHERSVAAARRLANELGAKVVLA